jgi:hypothetical protein
MRKSSSPLLIGVSVDPKSVLAPRVLRRLGSERAVGGGSSRVPVALVASVALRPVLRPVEPRSGSLSAPRLSASRSEPVKTMLVGMVERSRRTARALKVSRQAARFAEASSVSVSRPRVASVASEFVPLRRQ